VETNIRQGFDEALYHVHAGTDHADLWHIYGVYIWAILSLVYKILTNPIFYSFFVVYLTTLPTIFTKVYHEAVGITGLHYIALGGGLTLASQINARMMDKIYIYLKSKNGGKGEPEFRLPLMVPGSILVPFGLLLSGWSVEKGLHWISTDIVSVQNSPSLHWRNECSSINIREWRVLEQGLYSLSNQFKCTLWIHLHFIPHLVRAPSHGWTYTQSRIVALAAVLTLRSLAGFGFPLFAPTMYEHLGYGKGDTILAAFAVAIGCPAYDYVMA